MFIKIAFCKLILLIVVLLSSTRSHKMYYIEKEKFLNWNAANLECQKYGLHLLSIKTRAEFEFLKEYIKQEYGRILPFWLGAYRVNGEFVWTSSGVKIKQFFWHKDEPNDKSGNENCVHTWEEDFDWNDNDCERELPFICDREV